MYVQHSQPTLVRFSFSKKKKDGDYQMAKVKTSKLESINQLHLSIVWIKRWSFKSCVDSGDNSQ